MSGDRQVLKFTVVLTAVMTLFVLAATRGDWATALVTVPVVASSAYWSMRLSKRLSRRFAPPVRESASEAYAPVEATSERPEHAQRRRSRRKPRGRR